MALYEDIEYYGYYPERVRALAKSLLSHAGARWTDWELEFLGSRAEQPDGSTTFHSTALLLRPRWTSQTILRIVFKS